MEDGVETEWKESDREKESPNSSINEEVVGKYILEMENLNFKHSNKEKNNLPSTDSQSWKQNLNNRILSLKQYIVDRTEKEEVRDNNNSEPYNVEKANQLFDNSFYAEVSKLSERVVNTDPLDDFEDVIDVLNARKTALENLSADSNQAEIDFMIEQGYNLEKLDQIDDDLVEDTKIRIENEERHPDKIRTIVDYAPLNLDLDEYEIEEDIQDLGVYSLRTYSGDPHEENMELEINGVAPINTVRYNPIVAI